MAYFPPTRFFTLILLAAALLSGCCANNICNRDDSKEDIIMLVFAKSLTPNDHGFTPDDLDTLVILRYPLIINPGTKPESVTLIRTATQDYDTLFLNNTTPFAQVGATRLNQYKYVVRYYYYTLPPRVRRHATAMIIDSVMLKGSFDGDGCCTYYTNYDKRIASRQDSSQLESADTVYNLRPSPILKIYKR